MRGLFVVLAVAGCGRHEPADPPPPPLDRSSIYPLVVASSDLPTGPVRRPLVDGLVVTLASHTTGDQAKLLREPDLQGLALDLAYTTALANLEAAARRGEINVHAEVDASGHAVDVVWGHDWRAAACVLLPGARHQAEQKLFAGSGAAPGSAGSSAPAIVFAAIPNREVLVLFADPAVAPKALAAEHAPARKLTDRILRLVPSDQPFWIQAPVAWAD